jgi:hypothetical protein
MDVKTIIRTSAIIYAEEAKSISSKTIQRKIIESVFVENENKQLTVYEIISETERIFSLSFSYEEIHSLINNQKTKSFHVQMTGNNAEQALISLSNERFQFLKNKKVENNFDNFIQIFIERFNYTTTKKNVENIIQKYLYELLNTNIKLYSKIIKPTPEKNEITIDSTIFDRDEIQIINDFLTWEDTEKNKALFKIISYCIEYALVVNNSNGDNTYLASLRNKQFYLDNNLLYRALGINGNTRKERTLVFFKKCIDSGQELLISKFSKKEFIDTIEYHINNLKKLPFGRIDPKIFSKYCSNPSLYEYYHFWRNGRITYGFDSFYAYIIGEYESLCKRFNILEDYKIPYDESDNEIFNIIEKYKDEIETTKIYGFEQSHRFDAQNYFFIEKKRAKNNKNIQDTKYYLITTDQKLKKWDNEHSANQPITLLPSHWMGLLLKYYSRTDDDYKSFVSFLKLKQHDNSINEHELQAVLSGISEITEDFSRQNKAMEVLVERKFTGVIDSKNPSIIKENAKSFTKDLLEKELEETHISYKQQLESVKKLNEQEKEKLLERNKKYIDEVLAEKAKSGLQDKYGDVIREIKRITTLKRNAEERLEEVYKKKKFYIWTFPVIMSLVLFICVLIFPWDVMEKITWIVSALIIGLTYLYLAVFGKSLNPEKYFVELKEQIKKNVYREFTVDLSELNELKELENELNKKLNKA